MRITTGTARGVKLDAPEGIHTRPTSERAKQAIFNMLQFYIEGKTVLELFGGTGQLSLEALSRGAERAVICDNDRAACEVIKKNAARTRLGGRLTLLECEYRTALKKLAGRQFDVIFLDPPYGSDLLTTPLFRLNAAGLIRPGGFVVCESGSDALPSGEGLSVYRTGKYGAAYITVLRKEPADDKSTDNGIV
ncbi:MAG: 16S rRNA (guanine(966)-N(2))-methyltransferase RsmD [Clostridia bacterium]|nr:16S rRNA (guanine(966)-N(2))-methyltransferase RsmD [Clostridia bacterium]